MNKGLVILIICLFTIILSACGNENVMSKDKENESSNDIYTFKSTIQSPQAAPLSQGFDSLLNYIEEKSNGRIIFERYYGDALVKPADAADAVGAGIADVALLAPSYTPSSNPLSTLESLPALWTDQWTGTRALLDLFKEFPELRAEFEDRGISVLGAWALPSYHVISKTNVKSFDDVKNLKVIAAGGQALIADALGAVSVGVTMPESFEAMERGAVDGGFLGYTSSSTYGIHEVAKSVWTIPIGSQGGIFGMNKDKYNELPDDLKVIFDQAAIQSAVDFHNIYQMKSESEAIQKYKNAGVTINEASEVDIEKLQNIAKETVWKKWINSPERKGKPAEKILNRFIELINQYDEEYKTKGLPD